MIWMDGKMKLYSKLSMVGATLLSSVGVASAGGPPYLTPAVTPTITLLPSTTYGSAFNNLTNSNFSLAVFPTDVMAPFAWTTNGAMIVPFFLLFFGVYLSMWISHQNVKVATIVGLLFGSAMSGFNFIAGGVLPAPIVAIAYAALAASAAGIVFSVIK